MKCKYCQAEMTEEDQLCPVCGKAQEEEMPVEEAAAEVQPAAEEAPADAQPSAEETPAEEKKLPFETAGFEKPAETEIKEGVKATPGKIALAVAAVVVILAVLVALIISGLDGAGETDPTIAPTSGTVGETSPEETVPATIPADGNPDDATCKGTYTVTDDEIAAVTDTVIATVGSKELTLGQLQAFYWAEAGAYYAQYGESAIYFDLDFTRPLDTQICPLVEDMTMTWQQFFLQCALDNWHCYNALLIEAEEEGYVPEEDFLKYLEELPANFEAAAISNGAASSDEYVKTVAGAGCSVEDYLDYVAVYNKTYLYFNDICDKITATEAEINAQFDENQAEYEENGVTKDAGKYVDVRHILIMPDEENAPTGEDGYPVYSDEAWAACEAEARRIYDEWQTGDKSEDSFAQFARDYSVDGSASVGGLYEDVYKGQMVENFENWCFDEARQTGDHGLVKAQFGYHIMFFVDSTDIWYATAQSDVIDTKASQIVPAAMEKYPMDVDYSKIALGYVEMNY